MHLVQWPREQPERTCSEATGSRNQRSGRGGPVEADQSVDTDQSADAGQPVQERESSQLDVALHRLRDEGDPASLTQPVARFNSAF